MEYAIVTAGVLCMIVGLASLWRALSTGLFVGHALSAASHHLGGALGWAFDIFSY